MARKKDQLGLVEFSNDDPSHLDIKSKIGGFNYSFEDIETIATALEKSPLEVLYELSLKIGDPKFSSLETRPYHDLIKKS
jgi:hypothetical protein